MTGRLFSLCRAYCDWLSGGRHGWPRPEDEGRKDGWMDGGDGRWMRGC